MKKIFNLLLGRIQTSLVIALLCSFIVGISVTLKNGYLKTNMIRLIFYNLQEFVNDLILFCICVSMIMWVLIFGLRLLGKIKILRRINLFKSEKSFQALYFFLVLSAITGWTANYYFLPRRFASISLISDGVILIVSFLITWALNKVGFIKIPNRPHKTGMGILVIAILLLLNGWVLISRYIILPRRPNVLLLVVDCLRADHLSSYGYHRKTTPAIDRLAEKGLVYKYTYANAGWTKPSVASLFSSQYPYHHRAINEEDGLPDRILTVAEILKNHGYYTIFFNGGNVFIDKAFNFDQGFNSYIYHWADKASILAKRFISRINRLKKERFFAYIHYMDVHLPYNENPYNYFFTEKMDHDSMIVGHIPLYGIRKMTRDNLLAKKEKQYLIDLYDGQIRYVDESIQKIVNALRENHLDENTIIILTADHGEEFWEHGNYEHGHTLYNELLHVPCIITGPSITHGVIENRVSSVDIFPSVLKLIGIKTENLAFDGKNFLPHGDDLNTPLYAMATLYGDEKYCILDQNEKLIINTGDKSKKRILFGPHTLEDKELYQLNKDHAEQHNLWKKKMDNTHRLINKLNHLIQQTRQETDTDSIFIDEKMKDKLKSLGYM